MNAANSSVPARILKRADMSAEAMRPVAQTISAGHDAAQRAPAPAARHVAKEARLVPGTAATAAVEVRCSCGEWTRIELGLGDGRTEEVKP